MKHLKTSALLVAAISFAFTACDKKSPDGDGVKPAIPAPKAVVVDEKTAIANFKTEVETVGAWIDEKQKSVGADPAAGMAMVSEIVNKLQGIQTDGLPADLKAAWHDMNVVLGEMGGVFKAMPKIDESKPEETGKLMQEFMPKMMAIQAKVEPVAMKLQEVGMKYGLDMKKVAPGGK